ncbi:Ser/Thr protein phosphatase [Blastomyces gilchristii SLH14081]|uniref:Ser/Thr protein phosphatase n=2 Tax=Blastomyces TaxID=229219 RepID=A0A179UW97_BLAGS|nr:Ser/Thr protein phosphatase [Blastomyces gilchristii SLH14081]EGE83579.1 Ser/Thr protein phosphatase [Blastomyces dermatitidis ATCC 18188]EQL29114.1 hypothetical protein BDFG_08240 [Blastomyces dermatitidis ATCC 26199]OAT12324.1 Ser/Thr protein phosphatase [Blastomyces gilchristii SLH14081]
MMALSRLLSPFHSRKRLRVQIMSDLHLEVCQQYANFHITPRADRLILAGDIGRLADYEAFRDFLHLQCEQFLEVYLVLGNHEFFGVSREQGLRLAYMLQQEPGLKDKLTVMNQKRVDLQDITLLGCTLHSHIPPEDEESVRSTVNDFRHIEGWTVSKHVTEHFSDVKWLADEITSIRQTESALKRKIVVISHHAPSTKGTSRPLDEGSPYNSAFATNLLDGDTQSCFETVQCWIFGHTHYSTDILRGRTRLVSNQRGYVFPNKENNGSKAPDSFMSKVMKPRVKGKQTQDTFNPEMVIEV